jgi:hypothetical protein
MPLTEVKKPPAEAKPTQTDFSLKSSVMVQSEKSSGPNRRNVAVLSARGTRGEGSGMSGSMTAMRNVFDDWMDNERNNEYVTIVHERETTYCEHA